MTEFRVQLVEVNVVCNSERIIKIGTVLICQSYAQMKNGPVFLTITRGGDTDRAAVTDRAVLSSTTTVTALISCSWSNAPRLQEKGWLLEL